MRLLRLLIRFSALVDDVFVFNFMFGLVVPQSCRHFLPRSRSKPLVEQIMRSTSIRGMQNIMVSYAADVA